MSQELAALCADSRAAADRVARRSTEEWRRLWAAVRPRYRAVLAADIGDLATTVDLEPRTLQASMNTLLSGLAPETLAAPEEKQPAVTLVVLAASVPALAAQSLFPLLASGSAVILKPSRREPKTAALLRQVIDEIDTEVADAVSVVPELRLGEEHSLAGACLDRIVAYGDDATVDRIGDWARASGNGNGARVATLGHGWSAVYLEELSPANLAAIAQDVALFDQRGCLCPQVVITPHPAKTVVQPLGRELERIAVDLPASPDTASLGALRQLKDSAVAADRAVSEQALASGLVVQAGAAELVVGTPGGRSVRVYGDCPLGNAVTRLQPVVGRLQSLVIAAGPDRQRACRNAFASLGNVRTVLPGELHSPGFDWITSQLALGYPRGDADSHPVS